MAEEHSTKSDFHRVLGGFCPYVMTPGGCPACACVSHCPPGDCLCNIWLLWQPREMGTCWWCSLRHHFLRKFHLVPRAPKQAEGSKGPGSSLGVEVLPLAIAGPAARFPQCGSWKISLLATAWSAWGEWNKIWKFTPRLHGLCYSLRKDWGLKEEEEKEEECSFSSLKHYLFSRN